MALSLASLAASAQEAVQVGRGSYAAYPPTAKGKTDTRNGDKSTYMQNKTLYVDETIKTSDGNRRPIPTNDWWTDLINEKFADALWSYPQMVHPSEDGVTVYYPSYWSDDGTEVKWKTSLTVGGKDFSAISAIADNWHDWDVEMSMKSSNGKKQMYTTMVHGMPFTWIETKGMEPQISFSDTPILYQADGTVVTDPSNVSSGMIAAKVGDDIYGIYINDGIKMKYADGKLYLITSGKTFVSIALLPSVDNLDEYAQYAYSKPTSTILSWNYHEKSGMLTSKWTINAINLKNNGSDAPVMQGFLPHAYKNNTTDFTFLSDTYITPRGKLNMATSKDNTFEIGMSFPGMLPYYAAPAEKESPFHPFNLSEMTTLMQNYAENGTFGDDTYWGGKGLTQMALCMTFAHELDNDALFKECRSKLKSKLVDWLTYTPGESHDFFAYYPRWGGLVGFETSYDSDTFNDHHFHYGYFIYAGALLCMFDDDFKEGYGDMLRLIAKDYANWEHADSRFPFLRNLDPWAGHSYAGGLGDALNSNGNGQESSSEAMQSWGGLYLLGVAINDKEMRDAGIFGWSTESRASAEYWFDRSHVINGVEQNTASDNWNYDYSKYTSPYCCNLTSKGIGWWTWFSGDALWMHSIQWMPTSPCLNYLSQDLSFAKWDYESMMHSTSYKWFEKNGSNDALAEQSVGNVVLCYLERFDADSAAAIFDQAITNANGIAKNVDTGHISYYVIHSHRTYGDIDFNIHADIPTATAYMKNDGTYNYIIYNPNTTAKVVNFYTADGSVAATYTAPAHCMSVNGNGTAIKSDDDKTAEQAKEIPLFNAALNKTAHSSSEENAGTVTANVTDGNAQTRWGSNHSDDQWIYVDLGKTYNISAVQFLWETAHARSYEIQISDDASAWNTVKTVTNCTGGTDKQTLTASGRYVRMQGLSRSTAYGYSLYEFQVYGIPADATTETVIGMGVIADSTHIQQGGSMQLKAVQYRYDGSQTNVDAVWTTTDTNGKIDKGIFIPSTYGTFVCTATTADGASGSKEITVEETRHVTTLTVSPSSASIVVGGKVNLRMTAYDQFGGIWTVNDSIFTSNQEGTHNVIFTLGELKDTAVISVLAQSNINLAQDKHISASSSNGDGVDARYAVDGNKTSTRWESSWTDDDRYLTVDLEAAYLLSRIVIRWENAYANKYHIDYSLDGVTWRRLYTETTGDGSIDSFTVDKKIARYLRLTCDEKAMKNYGASIYEWEVYGSEQVSLMTLTSTDARHLVYSGVWDDAVFENNDNTQVTSVDLSDVTSLPEVAPATYNPNALFYLSKDENSSWDNLLNDGNCRQLMLTDGYDFAPTGNFTATNAYFDITLSADHYSIVYFPFQINKIPSGISLYQIKSVGTNIVTISPVTVAKPNHSYIIKSDLTGSYTFNGTNTSVGSSAAGNNVTDGGVIIVSTLTKSVAPKGAYLFNAFSQLAQVVGSAVIIYPFSGYILNGLQTTSGAKFDVVIDNSTDGILQIGDDSLPINGRTARYNMLGQQVENTYHGIIIENGKKNIRK